MALTLRVLAELARRSDWVSRRAEDLEWVITQATRDDAFEHRRLYLDFLGGAWLILAFVFMAADFLIGAPIRVLLGPAVASPFLIAFSACGVGCCPPGVAVVVVSKPRLSLAERFAARPGVDPDRARERVQRALPGAGLIVAQVVVALLAAAILAADFASSAGP